jgi:dsRNA-specific ribonuclease
MSANKRKWDTEYSYGEQEKHSRQLKMATPQAERVAPSFQGNNVYVESLIDQARNTGLLQLNGPGMPGYTIPSITKAFPQQPFSPAYFQRPVETGRKFPRYPQPPNQRPPLNTPTQNGNDMKRRKLNNSKNSAKKNGQTNKSKPTARKSGTKLPGNTAVDDQVNESLRAEALSTPSGPYAPASDVLPSFESIPKPENYPPPLPVIHDKDLEKRCFTHSSYVHEPLIKGFTTTAMHYERLEFLGDSYMNYCVTKILYARFPLLREGELTRFRSQIISNANIRHYATMYKFHERILLSNGAERDEVREAGKKVSDIFEAYIGGILTDQPEDGERVVFKWMQEITGPQIDEAEKIAEVLVSVNRNAKQELYVRMDAEKVRAPVYVVTRGGNTNSDFEVACLIQGKEIGRGVGKSKNEAGTRAAMQVLQKLKDCVPKMASMEENDEGKVLESRKFVPSAAKANKKTGKLRRLLDDNPAEEVSDGKSSEDSESVEEDSMSEGEIKVELSSSSSDSE